MGRSNVSNLETAGAVAVGHDQARFFVPRPNVVRLIDAEAQRQGILPADLNRWLQFAALADLGLARESSLAEIEAVATHLVVDAWISPVARGKQTYVDFGEACVWLLEKCSEGHASNQFARISNF